MSHRQLDTCPACHLPTVGMHRCGPARLRLTERGRDVLATAHLFLALLVTLALASALDGWLS